MDNHQTEQKQNPQHLTAGTSELENSSFEQEIPGIARGHSCSACMGCMNALIPQSK